MLATKETLIMSDEKQVYIPKSSLDSFGNALFAERLELGSREPTLMVSVNINQKNPQWSTVDVQVRHHLRGEEKNKTFDAPTKPQVVQAALAKLKEYAKIPYSSDEKFTTAWDILAPKIVNGKMTSERITKAKLVVGRTKKGPFMSVVHWNNSYPQIPFYAGLHDENNYRSTVSDDPEKLYDFVCANAVGWAEHISGLITSEWQFQTNKVLDNMRRNQNNNGGGSYGGGNNYNNNRQGGNSYGGGSNYETSSPSSSNGEEFSF